MPAKRISEPGKRHRRNNGPAALEVKPAPPLTPEELGTTTATVQRLIRNGPDAFAAAQEEAQRLSAKFGEQFQDQWLLETVWLQQLVNPLAPRDATALNRIAYALQWRPRFLAAVALTNSTTIGANFAHVSPTTVLAHRREDKDFDAQVLAAQEHAVQLLHDVCFAQAIEGNCEPVYWQGIRCGHIRKYPERLQIEMLRAHVPGKFKQPGSRFAVNVNASGSAPLIIIGPEERDRLVELRQRSLARLHEQKRALRDAGPVIDV